MLNPKSWYIIVKIFGVIYTSFGPYSNKDECIKDMIVKYDQAKAEYAAGRRLSFMGVSVSPDKVKGQCLLK